MRSSILKTIVISLLLSSCLQRSVIKPVTTASPPETAKTQIEEIKTVLLPEEKSRITIAAVGDVLIHTAVKKSADAATNSKDRRRGSSQSGYAALFDDVTSDLKLADLTFGNLETPVAPKTGSPQKPFIFNASPDVIAALKDVGFDLLSVANNHIYDQGRSGVAETIEHLEQARMPFIGIGRNKADAQAPYLATINGIRVAFLATSEFFNNNLEPTSPSEPQASRLDPDEIATRIKDARKSADFVVLSTHWGTEYQANPSSRTKTWAKQFFDAGADVILGHHPHVLQKVEVQKSVDGRWCFVIYSLGNFISNQSRNYVTDITPDSVGDTRDSVILYFDAVKRDYGQAGTRVELSKVRVLPVWCENDELVRSPDSAPRIRAISIDKTIDRLLQKRNTISDQRTADYIELTRLIKDLRTRRALIADRIGEDYVVSESGVGAHVENIGR